jgi:hypothetical protein
MESEKVKKMSLETYLLEVVSCLLGMGYNNMGYMIPSGSGISY